MFPLDDLIGLLRLPNGVANTLAHAGRPSVTTSVRWISDTLGVSSSRISELRATGLTAHQADVLANRVGYHPMTVWPAWPGDLPDCAGCGEPFMPTQIQQMFCEPACRRRKARSA